MALNLACEGFFFNQTQFNSNMDKNFTHNGSNPDEILTLKIMGYEFFLMTAKCFNAFIYAFKNIYIPVLARRK